MLKETKTEAITPIGIRGNILGSLLLAVLDEFEAISPIGPEEHPCGKTPSLYLHAEKGQLTEAITPDGTRRSIPDSLLLSSAALGKLRSFPQLVRGNTLTRQTLCLRLHVQRGQSTEAIYMEVDRNGLWWSEMNISKVEK